MKKWRTFLTAIFVVAVLACPATADEFGLPGMSPAELERPKAVKLPPASLFPGRLKEREYVTFPADGFSTPVTGVIYRGGDMLPGMPLGGIGTGFMALGTDGTFEYVNTLFNTYLQRGASHPGRESVPTHRLPFLGMSLGGETTVCSLKEIDGVDGVREIDYWGHYPVADLQFNTGRPVQVGLRAWTPFYPGDAVRSNTPGSVFEVRLHNRTSKPQKGTLAFSFSHPSNVPHRPLWKKDAINGRPGAWFFVGESEYKLPPVAADRSASALSGDPALTVFFLGVIEKIHWFAGYPVSLHGTSGPRQGAGLYVSGPDGDVRWVVSPGRDANGPVNGIEVKTPPGVFDAHWSKPVILCVRKGPGPAKATTTIWINGARQPLTPDSSSGIGHVDAKDVYMGAGTAFGTPNMTVGEILVYTRTLGDDQISAVGAYLEKKYGLDTAYPDAAGKQPDQMKDLYCWYKADGTAGLTHDGPIELEKKLDNLKRRKVQGPFNGITVSGKQASYPLDYAIGVIGDQAVRSGGPLGDNAEAWNRIDTTLPRPAADEAGGSVALDFSLEPREEKTARFVFAWHAPKWDSSYGNPLLNMYASRFDSSVDVADYLAKQHQPLLEGIHTWQQVVYGEKRLPGWLHDGLINVCAVIPQASFWMKNPDPGHWWGSDGFFCVNEGLLACAQQSCIGNDEFGEWIVNLLYPDLGINKLGAYLHYQKDNGAVPSTLGSGTEPDRPWYHQQKAMDGQIYVHMVDRYRMAVGNDRVLDKWYPSVKALTKWLFTIDEDGDWLPDTHGGNHYIDTWPMEGASTHIATYWLATLAIAERMAKIQGDDAFAKTCRSRYQKASESVQEYLWNEKVGSYLLYHDTLTGDQSDTVCCDQLIGEMFAVLHGLPSVLPAENIKEVLATLEKINVAPTPHGIRMAMRPDGSEDPMAAGGFIPSYSTLAPTAVMCGRGDPHFQKLGVEIVKRTWHNITCRNNFAWDQPTHLKPDGSLYRSLEYYHNTMLWMFPLAILGEDVTASCAPGGFMARVRTASQKTHHADAKR